MSNIEQKHRLLLIIEVRAKERVVDLQSRIARLEGEIQGASEEARRAYQELSEFEEIHYD